MLTAESHQCTLGRQVIRKRGRSSFQNRSESHKELILNIKQAYLILAFIVVTSLGHSYLPT